MGILNLPVIIGNNLEGFINGDIQPPPKTVQEDVAIEQANIATPQWILNPDYQQWHRLDQALLGWILSSISPNVQRAVVKQTSFQLWASFGNLFDSHSGVKLMQLKLHCPSVPILSR